jgi:hypothetical protein
LRGRPGVPAAVLVALALLAASFLGAASASAAGFVNGGFETGTLAGWSVYTSGPAAEWRVAEAEGEGAEGQPLGPPFDGRYAAVSKQGVGGGTAILYQDIALEPAATDLLRMTFGYTSETRLVIPRPDSLDTEPPNHNQQVRIDVMKPTAPIDSVAPGDILATVFASSESENAVESGEPSLEPQRFSVDLSALAGQTVRLRIAVAANEKGLLAEVDAVSVASTPLPPPPPPASTPFLGLSNRIQKGKLTLNRKNGTGFLTVTVPNAGTLTAIDAGAKVAVASMTTKGGHKPALIRATTLRPTAAGTIEVPIKPTASGHRLLSEKGRLRFQARLTFTPTGGTAATQVYKAALVKTLKSRR